MNWETNRAALAQPVTVLLGTVRLGIHGGWGISVGDEVGGEDRGPEPLRSGDDRVWRAVGIV